MKRKDIQNLVFSKCQKNEQPKKIFDDPNGTVALRTIERWCKLFRETSSVYLKRPPGGPRTISTKTTIQKVKRKTNRKIPLSAVKLAAEMTLSETTARRVLKKDLKLKLYKMTVQPSLTDQHKGAEKDS